MTDAKDAWAAVGSHLDGLALKLKMHLKEETAGGDAAGQSPFDKLGAAVQEAFNALGDAVRDEAVRSDVKAAGDAIVNAIKVTVNDARGAARGPDRTGEPPA